MDTIRIEITADCAVRDGAIALQAQSARYAANEAAEQILAAAKEYVEKTRWTATVNLSHEMELGDGAIGLTIELSCMEKDRTLIASGLRNHLVSAFRKGPIRVVGTSDPPSEDVTQGVAITMGTGAQRALESCPNVMEEPTTILHDGASNTVVAAIAPQELSDLCASAMVMETSVGSVAPKNDAASAEIADARDGGIGKKESEERIGDAELLVDKHSLETRKAEPPVEIFVESSPQELGEFAPATMTETAVCLDTSNDEMAAAETANSREAIGYENESKKRTDMVHGPFDTLVLEPPKAEEEIEIFVECAQVVEFVTMAPNREVAHVIVVGGNGDDGAWSDSEITERMRGKRANNGGLWRLNQVRQED